MRENMLADPLFDVTDRLPRGDRSMHPFASYVIADTQQANTCRSALYITSEGQSSLRGLSKEPGVAEMVARVEDYPCAKLSQNLMTNTGPLEIADFGTPYFHRGLSSRY